MCSHYYHIGTFNMQQKWCVTHFIAWFIGTGMALLYLLRSGIGCCETKSKLWNLRFLQWSSFKLWSSGL